MKRFYKLALSSLLLLFVCCPIALAETARFTPSGEVSVIGTFTVPESGTVLTISGTGTAVDGVEVKFPPGAVSGNTALKLGYEKGALHKDLVGHVTDVALVIDTSKVNAYNQPIEIIVPVKLLTESWKSAVGFAVDEDGRPLNLSVLASRPDLERRVLVFYTFRPLKMIWTKF